jgi:hypothetical protein
MVEKLESWEARRPGVLDVGRIGSREAMRLGNWEV